MSEPVLESPAGKKIRVEIYSPQPSDATAGTCMWHLRSGSDAPERDRRGHRLHPFECMASIEGQFGHVVTG